MMLVTLYLGQGFFELLIADAMQHKPLSTGHQAKQGSQGSYKEFQIVQAVWSNPCTGTCCASDGEQRTSGDKQHWTDRYSIASGHSWSPLASKNLPLAISTRSSLASQGGVYTDSAAKVHTLPFKRKPLSFPWLRRILLVFLGSVFSSQVLSVKYVHNILCNRIQPWIFSLSNKAAPIHFLHCCRLAIFACMQPCMGSFNSDNSLLVLAAEW